MLVMMPMPVSNSSNQQLLCGNLLSQLNIVRFQKPNENVIYSVVGEENIQVKTEVKLKVLKATHYQLASSTGTWVESSQRGAPADLRRLRPRREVDHARPEQAAQRGPQPGQPGEIELKRNRVNLSNQLFSKLQ